jgi:DNA repair protein RecN (Recombination protein N)
MLTRLSIRDVVLIDRLELTFHGSLSVLTGETGAGKSILLDALGLALGNRADSGLVRPGAERAQATATFELPPDHVAISVLAGRDIEAEPPLILRRVVGTDGRSRAYINDEPVSIGLLSEIGAMLVEVHGQGETRGLLNPATHSVLLDAYGRCGKLAATLERHWAASREAEDALATARSEAEAARSDEEFLRHSIAEIEAFAPEAGEEARLDSERRFLAAGTRMAEALGVARRYLDDDSGVPGALSAALAALERTRDVAAGRLDAAIAALERAGLEATDALAEIDAAAADADPGRVDQIADRLFALRALARKHGVAADGLPALAADMATRIAAIDNSDADLGRLTETAASARAAFEETAGALTVRRRKAAERLDKAIARELPPLKLDKAVFRTSLVPLAVTDWGPGGAEHVGFEIATNPGTEPGPLNRVASGGELARVMLALRVVLAGKGAVPTLVFDEVDSGISGATAAAVGERLARLGTEVQVLVVTHSPQVAARGVQHWRVAKSAQAGAAATAVAELEPDQRREEIARMLAGARITDEARAAADKLLTGGA